MAKPKCGYYDPKSGEKRYNTRREEWGCTRPNCHFVHPTDSSWEYAPESRLIPLGVAVDSRSPVLKRETNFVRSSRPESPSSPFPSRRLDRSRYRDRSGDREPSPSSSTHQSPLETRSTKDLIISRPSGKVSPTARSAITPTSATNENLPVGPRGWSSTAKATEPKHPQPEGSVVNPAPPPPPPASDPEPSPPPPASAIPEPVRAFLSDKAMLSSIANTLNLKANPAPPALTPSESQQIMAPEEPGVRFANAKRQMQERIKILSDTVKTRHDYQIQTKKCEDLSKAVKFYSSDSQLAGSKAKQQAEEFLNTSRMEVRRLKDQLDKYLDQLVSSDTDWLLPPSTQHAGGVQPDMLEELRGEIANQIELVKLSLSDLDDSDKTLRDDVGNAIELLKNELEWMGPAISKLQENSNTAMDVDESDTPVGSPRPSKRRRTSAEPDEDDAISRMEDRLSELDERVEALEKDVDSEQEAGEYTPQKSKQKRRKQEPPPSAEAPTKKELDDLKAKLIAVEKQSAGTHDIAQKLPTRLKELEDQVISARSNNLSLAAQKDITSDLQRQIANLAADVAKSTVDYATQQDEWRKEIIAMQAERESLAMEKQANQQATCKLQDAQKQIFRRLAEIESRAKLQANGHEVLTTTLNAVAKQSTPNMDTYLRQLEAQLRTDILPTVLTGLMKQQEENVVQTLLPKLNPTFVMIEEIYAFMKRVEQHNASRAAPTATGAMNAAPAPPS